MEMGNYASSSDNEDGVQNVLPTQKAPTGVLKFKCLHCSLGFASRKEYIAHCESHGRMQNNPTACKRTISQREIQPPHPTMVAMGPQDHVMMNQPPSLNLTLAPPPSRQVSLALALGSDVPLLPPPGFTMNQFHQRELDALYVKRQRNIDDHAQVDNMIMDDVGGTSGAGGGGSSTNGGTGDNGESGGSRSNNSSSGSGGTRKPVYLFDLNLPPPEE